MNFQHAQSLFSGVRHPDPKWASALCGLTVAFHLWGGERREEGRRGRGERRGEGDRGKYRVTEKMVREDSKRGRCLIKDSFHI